MDMGKTCIAVVVPQREPGMSGVDGSPWQGTWIQKQSKCGCLLIHTIGAMGDPSPAPISHIYVLMIENS